MPLEIDEVFQAVTLGEARGLAGNMLADAFDEIGGDADVYNSVWAVGYNVDPATFSFISVSV
jgi:hypothetical protein